MFQNYKINVDDKQFRRQLGDFQKKMPTIARRMMGKLASEIRKTTRKENLRGGKLKKQSGTLYKLINYKTKKDYTAYITAAASYASTHERGAVINAKKGEYLTFKIGEEWKKVKQVRIPQRAFLKPVIDDYFQSNKAGDIMDMVLQRELEKLFNKG